MSNEEFNDIRQFIEAEIYKYIPHIGASNEKVDKALKAKVIALVEALECINESDTIEAYGLQVRRMYRMHRSGADSLHDVLNKLEVKHRYP